MTRVRASGDLLKPSAGIEPGDPVLTIRVVASLQSTTRHE